MKIKSSVHTRRSLTETNDTLNEKNSSRLPSTGIQIIRDKNHGRAGA